MTNLTDLQKNWDDNCAEQRPGRCQLQSSEGGIKHNNTEYDKHEHRRYHYHCRNHVHYWRHLLSITL